MTQLQRQTSITILRSDALADQPYHDQLIVHLGPLQRGGLIKQWSDQQVLPGSNRALAIDQAIRSADILLLLISADFLERRSRNGKDEVDRPCQRWLAQEKRT